MLKNFIRILGGDPNRREIDRHIEVIDEINALEPQFEALSDAELSEKTTEFRNRLGQGETLDDLLPEAFAAVREASKRTIGLRHYDVQLIGGIVLHQGKIAEMKTGEGKTLVATLPLYLNALTGKGAHLVTVNDYLARRDARWMAPIYGMLGMNVGVLQMAARTENGKKAFLVDLERSSPHEDQHQLRMEARVEAYRADITYGTNSEFGFDYLRDNMVGELAERVQRGHYFAIVDEVDNILIDEARTPLIISGPAQDEAEWYIRMAQVVKALRPEDYEVNEKDRSIALTEIGETHVEDLLGMALRDPDRPEDVTPEQSRMLGYLEQALRAQHLFKRNKDYLVQAGKVIIIDEFTGRLMPGRRWSDGLHQAVEAKEGARVQSESVTYATITIQNYFRMYSKLAGMTGTAVTESEEFDKIYKLGVLPIPTNLEYQALRPNSELIEVDGKDEQGYKFRYYTQRSDTNRQPVFWRRKDYPDIVYRTQESKLREISWEILRYHVQGRPLLVGTTSVELSERVSSRLRAELLQRLAQIKLLRAYWLDKNKRSEEGMRITELEFLNVSIDKLDIPAMRKMARDLNISFNPAEATNLERMLGLLNLTDTDRERLTAVLQSGIPHQVLNARKHTEESQIIAGAGAFGAVTIATNMAGRGVDIKLGGELHEQTLAVINRVLNRTGYKDPYDMSMEERRLALQKLSPEEYGIYGDQVQEFLNYILDMERVRSLGGLHVIGSERHEARRIDNQLRGRAARQGDPGSSRFYLSMEDDLMRLFGGQQADALMQRLKIDDAMPLEVGLVGRLVEQAQTRVEGSNFDVRKHLLEYDDVLNAQRGKIYDQRNRILTKDDLTDDVTEMLETEVNRRVPEALKDEMGPWRLLAWLDQIQSPIVVNNIIIPSYPLNLLAEQIRQEQGTDGKPLSIPAPNARQRLVNIARQSLEAEKQHVMGSIEVLFEQSEKRASDQLDENLETLDTFFEGLRVEEEGQARRPADLASELNNMLHLPLKLTAEQQRNLRDDPEAVKADLQQMVESELFSQAALRLIGSVERRVEESLEINPERLPANDWPAIRQMILDAVENLYQRRMTRYLAVSGDGGGNSGQIVRELDNSLARLPQKLDDNALLFLLINMPQGARASFDKKTHKRVWQHTTRLTYIYYAAKLLENRPIDATTASVLEHLQKVQTFYRQVFGPTELTLLYRRLLLSVITELWIDYLTQMEALRVSIGLEAYAQRDPLVQYKSRAYGLFQDLLGNMRLGVISRMFTYAPRQMAVSITAQPENGDNASAPEEPETLPEPMDVADEDNAGVEYEKHPQTARVVEQPRTPKDNQAQVLSSSQKRRRHRR